MAANTLNNPLRAPNIFDICRGERIPQQAVPGLPSGRCNYVDLSPGANGARCGCRRFWLRQNIGGQGQETVGWCMCTHHACFHEDGHHDTPQQQQQACISSIGQENERPRPGREALIPAVDINFCGSSAGPEVDFADFSPGAPLSFVHDLPTETGDTALPDAVSRPPASLPDTLAWDEYMQSPPRLPEPAESNALPPIPPQCLMLSQTASTTSSVQAKYKRPFAGKGLDTLSVLPNKPISPLPKQHGRTKPTVGALSELALPLNSFTPGGHIGQGSMTLRPGTATQTEPRTASASQDVQAEARNVVDAVSNLAQRVDRVETVMETVSSTANAHEDCLDKHDHADLRVTDIEQRMEGMEETLADVISTIRGKSDEDDNAAGSLISAATSVASRVNPDHYMSEFISIKSRLSQLEAVLPTPAHAWTVEVVFYPFPLKRLWQGLSHFKNDPTVSNDDWTQMPMTLSATTMRSQSPLNGGWASAEHEAEWLYPRACGDKSTQYQRLRSRGLIRTVSFRGSDARSVQTAIHEAFGDLFKIMELVSRRDSPDPRYSRYLGLQEAWIPLRKIHKDSRLRFLNPAEMITSASWNVSFLHSVVMKAAEPKLFITHADAYIQNYESYEFGWAWQGIREMDRFCPSFTDSQEVKEADAMEYCWLWNEQLDEPPSATTSLNMRFDCHHIVSASPALVSERSHLPNRSVSPVTVRRMSPMLADHGATRPLRIRTASVPIVPAARASPASASRRVFSHGHSRHSSPFTRGAAQAGVQKRRRSTRSPSRLHYTPRWTASPSPMPFVAHDRQVTRGLTPLAYATPYSNAPLQELRPMRSSSVARSGADHLHIEYATDELFDIEIYDESASDESYQGEESDNDDENDDDDDDNESISSEEMDMPHVRHDSQHRQLPEDEPWPGIEDIQHLSDGENVDPAQVPEADRQSNTSSQPSEYPSTVLAQPGNDKDGMEFLIHED